MPGNLEIEKIRKPLPIPRPLKEQLLLEKRKEKLLEKTARRNHHQHKEVLGPYRLWLIGDKVYTQDEFPGNRIPANIKKIGQEI